MRLHISGDADINASNILLDEQIMFMSTRI